MYLLISLFCVVIVLYLAGAVYFTRVDRSIKSIKKLLPEKKRTKYSLNFLYLRLYNLFSSISFISSIQQNARKRYLILKVGSETEINSRTGKHMSLMIMSYVALIVISFNLFPSFGTKATILIVGIYFISGFSDLYISKLENKILEDEVDLLLLIKDGYQSSRMIYHSFFDASLEASSLVSAHAVEIQEIIKNPNIEDALEDYYRIAPNDYMRKLAGITTSIFKDGDVIENNQSQYVNSLGFLVEEIRSEILRRKAISNRTGFMVVLSMIPVFFIDGLKLFSVSMMPSTANFFNSSLGIYAQAISYVLVVIGYMGSKNSADPSINKPLESEGTLLRKWIKKYSFLRKIIKKISPQGKTNSIDVRRFEKSKSLLDNANSLMSLEEFYLKKIIFVIVVFIISLTVQIGSHGVSKASLVLDYVPNIVNGSASSSYTLEKKQEFESKVLIQYENQTLTREKFLEEVINTPEGKRFSSASELGDKYTDYLWDKINAYKNPIFKWYDPFIALLVAFLLGPFVPILSLKQDAKKREWQLDEETMSLSTLMIVLRKNPKVMVYTLLEWCYRYSSVFKPQFRKAFIEYPSGQERALENLYDSISYKPMRRLVAKLKEAQSKVSVKESFDGLETDMLYSLKNREIENEKNLEKRTSQCAFYARLSFGSTLACGLFLPWALLVYELGAGIVKITPGF